MFDCLRANKATMAHGLEVRVPFLDKEMIDETMMLDGELKMRKAGAPSQFVEKWLLREAFNTPETPYLPDEVLWRQKEQFSDGVGYDWIDGLKAHAEKVRRGLNSVAYVFPYIYKISLLRVVVVVVVVENAM